jgi:hypothetical protein
MQTEALAEGPIEEDRTWSVELTIQYVAGLNYEYIVSATLYGMR